MFLVWALVLFWVVFCVRRGGVAMDVRCGCRSLKQGVYGGVVKLLLMGGFILGGMGGFVV